MAHPVLGVLCMQAYRCVTFSTANHYQLSKYISKIHVLKILLLIIIVILTQDCTHPTPIEKKIIVLHFVLFSQFLPNKNNSCIADKTADFSMVVR